MSLPLGIRTVPRYDDIQERWTLRIEKMHHGNLKVGLIDEDVLMSGDFIQLRRTAETLADMFAAGGFMARGEKKQVAAGQGHLWLFGFRKMRGDHRPGYAEGKGEAADAPAFVLPNGRGNG